MPKLSLSQKNALKKLFDYLYLRDKAEKAEVIIGFGHFDMAIPEKCFELYKQGYADKIIFTGGIGAGTADLGKPEAMAFKDRLLELYPDFDMQNLMVEQRSGHTGENCAYTNIIVQQRKNFLFNKALIVASPSRQRRVYLTCKKHWPRATFINVPPESSFNAQKKMFSAKKLDFRLQITGEIERLISYPNKGFILEEKMPEKILEDFRLL